MAHKYRAKPRVIDGQKFASTREAARYCELALLEKAGHIANLELYPSFPLHVLRLSNGEETTIGKYTADFSYYDVAKGTVVIEDVKSGPTKTEAYRLRKRIVEAQYDFQITEVR